MGPSARFLKKIPRRWSQVKQSNFYYRQSAYDIGLAVSVTDEIINLEPLEDKVNLLRQKYEQTTIDVLTSIKSRLNFFSVY